MSDISTPPLIKGHLLKITAALYRVTDLFQDEEPLKWSLRRTAMQVVDTVYQDADGMAVPLRIKNLEVALDAFQILQKKLFLAQVGGFISRLNFEVLEREYQRLQEELKGWKTPILESDTKLLDMPVPVNLGERVNDFTLSRRPSGRPVSTTHNGQEKKLAGLPAEASAKAGKIPAKASSSINERQHRILQFLEGKDWLGVGDIAPIYGDSVSAKTVQRDLNELLARGLIQSLGERRWRRYAARVDSGA